jgi:hexokinase
MAEEGLAKNATTMSQIPTYVTAVPNGTEKVRIPP